MEKKQQRIEVLKNILLRLHQGESPESVQEEFNQTFAGVNAIEISLMEHELINAKVGIGFEDVMELCNVHANLFKGAVDDVSMPEMDKEGHPVRILKNENAALQAAIMRIDNLWDNIQNTNEIEPGMLKGLKRQYDLLGQFEAHYQRKEEVIFPYLEKYGHDAPPVVMWGVDDEIRQLFKKARLALNELGSETMTQAVRDFETFKKEFLEMVFKEESILIPLLLSVLNEDDWLAIAKDTPDFGYAIVKPETEWLPERKSFETMVEEKTLVDEPLKEGAQELGTLEQEPQLALGKGFLSLKEVNLILNTLPLELTFIDKDDIFKYFNVGDEENKAFQRSPSAIGRNVRNCHPPKALDKVLTLIEDIKTGRRDKESMWFKMKDKYLYVTYHGVRDENGAYVGIIEYVQDIQPFFDLEGEKRDLSP